MPILLRTERRHIWTRAIVIGMYTALVLGGLTMIYPFLLMVSGATKSNVDVHDLDLVPRYLHDDAMLYRKYIEQKCNEQFSNYSENYPTDVFSFRDVGPPAAFAPALVADWREFTARPMPSGMYMLGASISNSGQNVPPNLRAFRERLRKLCGGDIQTLQDKFGLNAPTWMSVSIPYEPLADRNYQRTATAFMEEFYGFKESRPPQERICLSCDRRYSQYVAVMSKYKDGIAAYNRLNGTEHKSFAELSLSARCPGSPGTTEDWESFVRDFLNPQFILIDNDALPGFARFLEQKYGTIAKLNKLYSTPGKTGYSRFDEVPFPSDRVHPTPALTDFAEFLKDRELLPARHLQADSPEVRWRSFLQEKYGTASPAGQAHGREYPSFAAVTLPQGEADYAYCLENSGKLRRQFLRRNFDMVFEYILLYGRGIRNTVIYCLLAIGTSLLVNPVAAYALSRYNLPGQYKVLLFLIATMAFPPVVTMIPNFLLLKELNLLNTFAALILPGMANGYAIFLLKGFFDSLPRELYEAADIDGATEWHKFWIVTMTLSKPILAVIALGAFIGAYSNFMMAFIVCQEEKMWTLMVWLFKLQSFASQGVIFASLLVAAVPTLIMFIFCQNLIIRGIVVPTEK